jgi:aspartyl/asparaginyl-tRNA synthetase
MNCYQMQYNFFWAKSKKGKKVTSLISPHDFTQVTTSLRQFFLDRNFLEVHTQNRLSILAACEDPTTVATYQYSGETWPLPQTGQMWLEYELLNNPKIPGCFCVSTSYRQEQNPTEGRHELIFPMFEFESHGNFDDLINLESDLCTHLGFKCDHNRAPYDDLAFPGGIYMSLCAKYTAPDNTLEAHHEIEMYKDFGDVFFLTRFPYHTSPFWNMKKSDTPDARKQPIANKCDVIIGGMETIGSAERADDVDEMREQFHTISDGGYANLLYELFGKKRVLKELDEFLSHDFFPRFGGGIGITRMISGMRKAGLL